MESAKLATWDYEAWRSNAKCREMDPGWFFPVGVTGDAEIQIRRVKEFCAECAVSLECLEFALRTNQEYGIWGGKDEEERRMIRRIRRIQRRTRVAS
ncbi:WhiB family transcriptional regulator [Ferrimicrobium acidiphilum]|jgi:WhiB family redox-sensing transcriptional regulator|uniref:Transcriptional regulator WhiB n=1 Tax=Ferrimicrobium acidiphilum DSM 19497 TaxID=1121877 RepID=A0A0D8FUB1_9ACTN|nr:WhiB family transcriptional regulator [Ferrimicrobium acidiphilum]KJE76868.1 transcriptional regulator WhiB1 [Ferrimicrobium acidiphilum DSM 19497]MCL5053188.1 WhiB family transcriptional regulator [Gammaproteobacteria bacterium]